MAWAEVCFRTEWCLHPSSHLATIDMGQKLGAVPLLGGGGGAGFPSNTMSPALRSISVQSGILIHLAVVPQQMGRKLGAVPLFWGGAEPLSNTKLLGPKPTSIPIGILVHPAIWPQRTWVENCGGLCSF